MFSKFSRPQQDFHRRWHIHLVQPPEIRKRCQSEDLGYALERSTRCPRRPARSAIPTRDAMPAVEFCRLRREQPKQAGIGGLNRRRALRSTCRRDSRDMQRRVAAINTVHCVEDGSVDDRGRALRKRCRHGRRRDQRIKQHPVPIGYLVRSDRSKGCRGQ